MSSLSMESTHGRSEFCKRGLVITTVLCAATIVSQPGAAISLCEEHSAKDGEQFVITRPRPALVQNTKPEIIGGTVADPNKWPATMIFCSKVGTFCTSTAIGPRVVLTAAHCLDGLLTSGSAGVSGRLDRAPGGHSMSVTCMLNPTHKSFNGVIDATTTMKLEWSADIAICKGGGDMGMSAYERILLYADRVKPHDLITLLGLGCTTSGGGGTTEQLYQGPAPIIDFISNTYFMHTQRDPNNVNHWAALCKGDSGGAGYKTFDDGKRYVVGIASLSDNKRESWLTSTTTSDMLQFIRAQTNDNDFAVCGLNPQASPCQ
jgi:hypothetical protein